MLTLATWEGVHMDAIKQLVNEYINARGITQVKEMSFDDYFDVNLFRN